jgi:hypothetical protein
MARKIRPALFVKRDVARAIKAVQDAGLPVSSVRIEPNGAILVTPGTPPAAVGVVDAAPQNS